jgi:hypothetical protein
MRGGSAALIAGFLIVISDMAQARGSDLQGIFLNDFNGQFSGAEWFQVIPGPAEGSLLMTDIRGGGFTVTVGQDGSISFAGGEGSLIDGDNFILFPFDGQFTFSSRRVPLTGRDFPLLVQESLQPGDPLLAGVFQSLTEFFDPRTGALTSAFSEELNVTVEDTVLRITDPQGLFFQGVFLDGDTVGFRDISNALSTEFASFPGSQQNLGQDMLGELQFSDADNFTATILLQTLAQLGSEDQLLVRFTARRTDRTQGR